MLSKFPPLGYLLGGGARRKVAGVAVPLDKTDSAGESEVTGREMTTGLWEGGRGKRVLLRKDEVKLATPPTMRPTMEAHAKNT